MHAQTMFAEYEDEAEKQLLELRAAVTSLAAATRQDYATDQTRAIQEWQRRVCDLRETLQHLDLMARSEPLDPKNSRAMRHKVASLREDTDGLSQQLNALDGEHKRRLLSLNNPEGAQAEALESEAQQRLLGVAGKIEHGTAILEESRRKAVESEQVGSVIVSDLYSQREIIMRSSHNVRSMGRDLSTSQNIMSRMGRRISQNRRLLYGVLALIGGVFLLLLVYRIWKA
eukprot:Polyplicarium_translucidae@DN1800_c0_g1_i1.p1